MAHQHAVIAQHVKARWRDESAKAADEIEGLEKYGVGAVFPCALEANAHATVGVRFKTLEGEWWPSDVPTQTLKTQGA